MIRTCPIRIFLPQDRFALYSLWPGGHRKFPMAFNLKTAKALGLSPPESFSLLADEVIE
jgi:hypothetical protein